DGQAEISLGEVRPDPDSFAKGAHRRNAVLIPQAQTEIKPRLGDVGLGLDGGPEGTLSVFGVTPSKLNHPQLHLSFDRTWSQLGRAAQQFLGTGSITEAQTGTAEEEQGPI